jgi:hypothetical protein
MQKWEYKVIYTNSMEEIQELGEQGWELVAVDNRTCYFKRPVPESQETRGK